MGREPAALGPLEMPGSQNAERENQIYRKNIFLKTCMDGFLLYYTSISIGARIEQIPFPSVIGDCPYEKGGVYS